MSDREPEIVKTYEKSVNLPAWLSAPLSKLIPWFARRTGGRVSERHDAFGNDSVDVQWGSTIEERHEWRLS